MKNKLCIAFMFFSLHCFGQLVGMKSFDQNFFRTNNLAVGINTNGFANTYSNSWRTDATNAANLATNGYPWGSLYDAAGAALNATNNPSLVRTNSGTLTSAQLAIILTDETGTGSAVFSTNAQFGGSSIFGITTASGVVMQGPNGGYGYQWLWKSDHLQLTNTVFLDLLDFNHGLALSSASAGTSVTLDTANGNVSYSGVLSGDVSGATNIPAGKLTGSIADARLSANVPLLNGANVFTAANKFVSTTNSGTSTATNGFSSDAVHFSKPPTNTPAIDQIVVASSTSGDTKWSAITYPMSTFASSSNTLTLNNSYWSFNATTNVAVTGIAGPVAGYGTWATLAISNSSAGTISAYLTVAGARLCGTPSTTGATNGLQIANGKVGIISVWAVGTAMTNWIDTVQQ